MIEKALPYIADTAPGLFVAFVMAFYMLRRMARLEDRICAMLEKCMDRLITHLDSEHEQ